MTPIPSLTCFKAYDIRGRLGDESGRRHRPSHRPRFCRGDGRAAGGAWPRCAAHLGRWRRRWRAALMAGGRRGAGSGPVGDRGDVFRHQPFGADGGICVTASHNPMDYNGMKMVRAGSAPIGRPTGMAAIKALAESGAFGPDRCRRSCADAQPGPRGLCRAVLGFVDVAALKPMKVLVNAGHGAAGPTFDAIADALAAGARRSSSCACTTTPMAAFPNGIPNPLLPMKTSRLTAGPVIADGADFGVAWDGDFDRCFFFDHRGRLRRRRICRRPAGRGLPGQGTRGAKIVHDPRVVWNTRDIVAGPAGRRSRRAPGMPSSSRRCATPARLWRRDVGASLFPRLHGIATAA
jgi:phosphomannomutase